MKTCIMLSLMALLFGGQLHAQTYRGAMTTEGYTRKDVTVKLDRQGEKATIMIFNTKFARMMPVKVDVDIPEVSVKGAALACRQVVPMSKGKPFDKYIVRNLKGEADGRVLRFTCTMGDKKVSYSGTATTAGGK